MAAATVGSTEFVNKHWETHEICAGREEATVVDEATCPDSAACCGQSASRPTSTCDAAMRAEEATILKLALPIVISNFLNFLMNIVDLAMVGQLGRDQLAAASLAIAYYNTFFYPLSGAAMALDTLLSQTYGAQQYVLYGQWLVSGCAVMSLMCVPVIIALLLSEAVLVGVGLDVELATRASQFIHLLIPGMLPNVFFMLFTKYLQVRPS
jgi:MATE family multidrug resistance protein